MSLNNLVKLSQVLAMNYRSIVHEYIHVIVYFQ